MPALRTKPSLTPQFARLPPGTPGDHDRDPRSRHRGCRPADAQARARLADALAESDERDAIVVGDAAVGQ